MTPLCFKVSSASKLALSLLLLTALFGASGCASLHSVSVTSIPQDRSRPVEAKRSNTAFLGIHFSNKFVNGLEDDLRKDCPEGRVSGVFTKYETHSYVIVTRRRVTAHGFCVKPESESAAATPPVEAAKTPDGGAS
jgi:hypothetical protein